VQTDRKQPAVDMNTTEETVAVVNQANRVQVRLQNMSVRLGLRNAESQASFSGS
jgi:hypothetical protein